MSPIKCRKVCTCCQSALYISFCLPEFRQESGSREMMLEQFSMQVLFIGLTYTRVALFLLNWVVFALLFVTLRKKKPTQVAMLLLCFRGLRYVGGRLRGRVAKAPDSGSRCCGVRIPTRAATSSLLSLVSG